MGQRLVLLPAVPFDNYNWISLGKPSYQSNRPINQSVSLTASNSCNVKLTRLAAAETSSLYLLGLK
jgi:hypothetical protein